MFKIAVDCPNPKCDKKIKEDWSDYIVDQDVNERNMGAETEYSIECDGYTCPKCGKNLRIFGSVWEYPVGAYNYDDLKAEIINDGDEEDDE